MTYLLTDSPKHALLAMTIKEAQQVAQEKNTYVGRTALQKICYFAQRIGVPFPYRFDLYHYGPFCQDIYTDVEYLIADDVVKDSSERQKYSNYCTNTTNIADLLKRHKNSIDKFQEKIRNVVQALIPRTPQDLEVIATLDYLYQQEAAKNPDNPSRDNVVNRFMEVKKDKYPRQDIVKVYDTLKEQALLSVR